EALVAAGFGKPLVQVLLEQIEARRIEAGEQEAVGDFGAQGLALGSHRPRVDRNVLSPVKNALERFAEPASTRTAVRDLIALALKLERLLARKNLPHDRH